MNYWKLCNQMLLLTNTAVQMYIHLFCSTPP